MEKSRFVLFDGNAIIHRAYHAFGATGTREAVSLTVAKTGEVVSAVYGFALMLLKVLNELKPTHYAVAFDKKGPTFRHDMFDDYKAQRPPTPDDLVAQFGRVRELVQAFNIPIFEIDKYEADDVLGTLSRCAAENGMDAIIVTGDADAMQLVNDSVRVLYPKAGRGFSDTVLFDAAAVTEKFGVGPEYVADFKALVGDTSDNIPGVSGIGAKTAVKLISQFGSIDDIYEHLDDVTPDKLQQKLRDNEDIARKSKVLATIVTDIPLNIDLDECMVTRYDRERVVQFLRELDFFSLINKLPPGGNGEPVIEVAPAAPEGDYRIVSSPEELDTIVARLGASKGFAFDTETTGLNPMLDRIVGVSLAAAPGEAWYIPLGHTVLDAVTQLPLEEVIDRLRPLFNDEKLPKYGHNAKFDMHVLAHYGIEVAGLTVDTMIAAHLLNMQSLGLKNLSRQRLGIEMTEITELIGKGAKQTTMDRVDITLAGKYAAADADMTFRLVDVFKPELEKEGLTKLFAEVEMPLVPVLLDMERNGIALDPGILHEMSRNLGEQIALLEQKIFSEAKHEFNINSPAQLGKVLFEEMQIPSGRRSKGKYSTDAAVLEFIAPQYPIARLILEYRQLTKIKSTYIDPLPGMASPDDGRIHTSFNQTRTATGRLSSTDPNMQNIPVRSELGGQVRQAFVAPEGSVLLGGDYSQIDLRALAHLSGDEALVRAFKNNEDIHAATAALLFNVPAEQVTPDQRRFAKTINFGVIYGMSDYGLQQATDFSREEAGKFIKSYFEKYPGVTQYLEKTREQARTSGYVETLLGRRRYIQDINASNRMVREAAERMAINMPVQGTSADIIKVAMINLRREMQQRKLASRMLLQVHDELVFEVPAGELDDMRKLIRDVMESAVTLAVPVKVDTKTGKNWGEMKA